MYIINKFSCFTCLILLFKCMMAFAQESTAIMGKVIDQNGYEVPYAAVGILQKNIGTTSTEDGTFYFRVTNNELEDNLTISSLGFSNFSIKIKDFLKLEKKEVVLKEQTTNLSEVIVNSVGFYVKNALKNLRNNTVSKNHQLNILYRRWSVEDNLCRFFIEHSINAIDRGPSSYLVKFSINHARASADYRFVKTEQDIHALKYMEYNNPLRQGIDLRSYKWQKTENSTYDNEDVIIAKGVIENEETLSLYIGMDTYKIYKLEVSKIPKQGKSIISTYIYKKNNKGKLYLSYHQREWKGFGTLSENVKRVMISNGKTPPKHIPIAFRHEVYVLNIEENKSYFDTGDVTYNMDMTKYTTSYDPSYWEKLSIPPNTRFYNKNIGELVNLYGVSLENQFKYSNIRL